MFRLVLMVFAYLWSVALDTGGADGASGDGSGDDGNNGGQDGNQGDDGSAATEGEAKLTDEQIAGKYRSGELLTKKSAQAITDEAINKRFAEEKRKQESAAETARREEREKAAEKSGEFQTLAKERADRIIEIEGERDTVTSERDNLKGERDKAVKEIKAIVKGEKESGTLPDYLVELLDEFSPFEQLSRIRKYRQKYGDTQTVPSIRQREGQIPRGQGGGPEDAKVTEQEAAEARAYMRRNA